jgi:predicted Fe-Mo cluster-binding NifX family protein
MLEMLNLAGMIVYQAESESVRDNVELLKDNGLEALSMMNSAEEGKCGGKDESHACTHDHDACTHDHEGCENAH